MPEAPQPQGTPHRPRKEYDDNHYHDEDEVAQPPADDAFRPAVPLRPATPPARKLPPPPRRFYDD